MSDEFEEERLDSPLIVHKITDASYRETASVVDVDATHGDSDGSATLERHRFKRVKKKKKWPYVLVAVVAAVAVFCGLYFGGVFKQPEPVKETAATRPTYLTEPENKFKGYITVKGAYVFFEGEEVDGLNGLSREIKYLPEGSSFIVQDENADDTFLGQEILPLLDEYGIKYEVKFIVSSGLKSKYETETTAALSTQPTAGESTSDAAE